MRRRGDEGVETPVAALIDVVFLLIIFFLVTNNIDRQIVDESINLADAKYASAVEKKSPQSVIINIKENGSVNIAKQPMTLRQLQNILTTTYNKQGRVPIILRVDGNAPYKYVADVQEVITKSGFYQAKLAAEATE